MRTPYHIVLLNGPPRCGKDTIGNCLAGLLTSSFYDSRAAVFKFADALKRAAHRLYLEQDLPADEFEQQKDQPLPQFFGKSPRQVYIALSETMMKPLHGPRIWGRVLADEMADCDLDYAVITDSGFREEADVLIEDFGAENVSLVRITRPGTDFSVLPGPNRGSDSRSYWTPPEGVRVLTVRNEGPLASVPLVADEIRRFVMERR